ncbi:unnamed protein product [Macrosiphum euphorbiae]|uniref:Uncharacterized protein n=1 Tax=Macrosiphum euphorbiae TaxID=13131 RepID=A0AAV0WFK8_9HEMI|nr:unnamed protein product [Macrosiphum euphorbiae]
MRPVNRGPAAGGSGRGGNRRRRIANGRRGVQVSWSRRRRSDRSNSARRRRKDSKLWGGGQERRADVNAVATAGGRGERGAAGYYPKISARRSVLGAPRFIFLNSCRYLK